MKGKMIVMFGLIFLVALMSFVSPYTCYKQTAYAKGIFIDGRLVGVEDSSICQSRLPTPSERLLNRPVSFYPWHGNC